jgi:hypothetical protein
VEIQPLLWVDGPGMVRAWPEIVEAILQNGDLSGRIWEVALPPHQINFVLTVTAPGGSRSNVRP